MQKASASLSIQANTTVQEVSFKIQFDWGFCCDGNLIKTFLFFATTNNFKQFTFVNLKTP